METTIEVKTINGAQGVYAAGEQVINVDVNDRGTQVGEKVKAQVEAGTLVFLDGVSIGYGTKAKETREVPTEITVTEEDMANNPDLADIGVKAGDVIGIELTEKPLTEEVIVDATGETEEVVDNSGEMVDNSTTEEVVETPKKKKA